MNDAATRECFLAIRERIKIINLVRAENSPQAEKAGLVSAYRVIDALARRFIQAPEWPGHEVGEFTRLIWEYEWYSQYCEATMAFCKAMQSAVKDKRLTLRNSTTRLPVDQSALNSWLMADIDALQFDEQNGFMSQLLSLSPNLGRWPDNACLPPTGAIIPEDVAVWVASEGLASLDDALLLPICKLKPQTATPALDSASNTSETQSTPMKKAALIAALEHEWPSIEADLREATRNGLKDAAHTGKHGDWDREKAHAWAVRKNKIKQAAPVHHLAKWPGTVTRNQF